MDSNEDLSRGGKAAASLIAKAVVVFVAGWGAHHLIGGAQAAVPSEIRAELSAMHDDILLIKCRLGIEGRCPPPPPIHTAGPSR